MLLSDSGAGAVSTSAGSAILMDADSGRILYAQNEREQRPIASITKLMTALVVCERMADLEAEVTISSEAAAPRGSSMYLVPGEQVTVRALLYGLLLSSGNDAAVALAIYCAGDAGRFTAWMNARASELSMADTHFDNPNGLDSPTHYSTAYDMALLAGACLHNETVAEMVATKSIVLGERTLVNHNKLLWRYPDCVGMKTGYTDLAGRTLISSACRNGQTLVAVTLRDPNDWEDHKLLLDYGFENFPEFQLTRTAKIAYRVKVAGSLVPAVMVATDKELRYPVGTEEQVSAKVTLPPLVRAPVAMGETLGTLSFYLDGKEIGTTNLTAVQNIPDNVAPVKSRIMALLDLLRK
ncbi:MAG: D-alanyl-D-alanine carboxypeptidase family protein [Oscillospiraceae bacterium]